MREVDTDDQEEAGLTRLDSLEQRVRELEKWKDIFQAAIIEYLKKNHPDVVLRRNDPEALEAEKKPYPFHYTGGGHCYSIPLQERGLFRKMKLEDLLRRMGAIQLMPTGHPNKVSVIWKANYLPNIMVDLENTPFEETENEIRIGEKGRELLIVRKPSSEKT